MEKVLFVLSSDGIREVREYPKGTPTTEVDKDFSNFLAEWDATAEDDAYWVVLNDRGEL